MPTGRISRPDSGSVVHEPVLERALLPLLLIAVLLFETGSAVAQGTSSFEWSDLDTLTRVTTPQGTTSYTYDGDRQRVSATDSDGTIIYIRDEAGNLIAEYDQTSGEYTDHVYMGPRRVASITGKSSSEERRYFHIDQVGTPLVATDGSGAVVWRGEALPFGEEVRNSDLANDGTLKFTGKELDEDTGLHYFGARYYDAKVGRFISVDPVDGRIENPQSMNRYAYARNNPLVLFDPDGRQEAISPYVYAQVDLGAGKLKLQRSVSNGSVKEWVEPWNPYRSLAGVQRKRITRTVTTEVKLSGDLRGKVGSASGTIYKRVVRMTTVIGQKFPGGSIGVIDQRSHVVSEEVDPAVGVKLKEKLAKGQLGSVSVKVGDDGKVTFEAATPGLVGVGIGFKGKGPGWLKRALDWLGQESPVFIDDSGTMRFDF